MKKQLLRLTSYFITVYLFISAFNSTFASPFHHEHPANNRRYARTLTNLNVGEPRTVRLLYFLPNDRPYRPEVVQKMKDTIRTIQTFYAEQMEAHGYGKVTFRVETDSQGEPIVHRVDGGHPFSYYDNTLGSEVSSELQQAFDMMANIYFVVLGADALRQGDGQPALGVGYRFSKNGGDALVPNEFSWDLVAHELGHAFGLGHDFRDGEYIMSYGPGQSRLSQCAADFLAVHSYFNPDTPIEVGEPPTIKLISPRRYAPGSMSVPVRLQVNDSEGVYQVLLSAQGGLQACRGLNGDRNGVVEFEYNGGYGLNGFTSLFESTEHTILVHTVNTEGNVSDRLFTVSEASPHHIDTLVGHVKSVQSVSFSENGILASGSWDTTVRLWDVTTRQNIATLPHMERVNSVVFSRDGILASGDGSFDGPVLWDVEKQQEIARFNDLTWVYSVSFSPDGKILAAGGGDGKLRLWDVVSRKIIDTLTHGVHVLSVSFSRDGILASGYEDGTVKLWDVVRRQQIATLPHEHTVLSVTFSPEGGMLVAGGWGGIELWDVATESRLDTLTHGATVSSVSFSTDGETLASGGWDGTVKLWDMKTRQEYATFGPTTPVYSVTFSPDGSTIASGTAEGTVELWDISWLDELREASLTPVEFADINLANKVRTALGLPAGAAILKTQLESLTSLDASQGDKISDLTGLEHASQLAWLNLDGSAISDITPLAQLTRLTELHLYGNAISDITPLAQLTGLTYLLLDSNAVSDITPLVQMIGLTYLQIRENPLTYPSIYTHIPALQERGVNVHFDPRTPQWIRIVSGDNQQALSGEALASPFVVEIQDQNGAAFEGVPVTFTVASGGGTLSATSAATDSNGKAKSTLTLGPNPGTNTVVVAVPEIHENQSFTAEAVGIPQTFQILSGNNQEGVPGKTLENPFVVEVRDQSDKPLSGVQVTFSVASGGGTLSTTSVTTDSNGRVESTLTLGPTPGTNTVTVSVEQIQSEKTFTAKAIRIPKSFRIISGDNQQGYPGAALTNPFIVEVQDQSGEPLPDVQVTFTVSSGGGTLSKKIATTDSNGRAESTLTLGSNAGANIVTVSVAGIQEKQTFTAKGIRIPKTFVIVSGDDQQGLPGAALEHPFVVEVLDQFDKSFPRAQVTFAVTNGGGTLSVTIATTDSDGRAESTLTLGPNPGTNTVEVTVTGVQGKQIFTAEGVRTPKTFVIVSGDDQQGLPGDPLVNPFVVEVLDPSDNALPGVQVTFSVTSGGGRLSATTATTDSDGRSESTLTLGPNPGTNTVTVSVTGIQEGQTFNAEGIRTPLAFWITSGFDQKGTIGEALPRPIVVYVAGQSGEPFPDVEVTFTVIGGGGTLSVTRTTTDSDGQAESTLTLGPDSGTNTVEVAVAGILQKQTATAIGELPPIPEDVNRDEVVNILDLVLVASVLGDGGTDLEADVNGDGVVNILDLVLVAGALEGTAAAPAANP